MLRVQGYRPSPFTHLDSLRDETRGCKRFSPESKTRISTEWYTWWAECIVDVLADRSGTVRVRSQTICCDHLRGADHSLHAGRLLRFAP